MSQLLYSKYRECFVFEQVIEDDFRFTRRDESFSMGAFFGRTGRLWCKSLLNTFILERSFDWGVEAINSFSRTLFE